MMVSHRHYLNNQNASNKKSLLKRIDQVFNDYSKVLTIRLDLYLSKSYNSYENINKYLGKLNNYSRSNNLFRNLISSTLKVEYADQRLWHVHALFLFNGHEHRKEYFIAKSIGNYWVDVITNGAGSYYSANMNKTRYDNYGLGLIKHNEHEKIADLKQNSLYLTKVSVIKDGVAGMNDSVGKNYRSFRQSLYKPKNTNVGRPRNYEDHNNNSKDNDPYA